MKKFTAIMLAVLMIVSIMPMSVFAAELPDKEAVVPSVETNLESGSISNDYGLSSNIHDGAILHAWCWSFNTIKEQLPNIAEAGFTSVQTSPINQCKVGNGGGLQLEGCWYYQYQPTQYTIGNYQLGTLDEFRDLCNEADKYGIKIIVDVVANHCSSDYSAISTEIKNIPNAFHPQLEITSWSKRYQLTQGKLSGLWDLNTANLDIQNMIKNYLEECLEAGADGFRFDAAKHIELPDEPAEDDHDFKSDFWTNVLDNDAEFQYGEILQGDNSDKIAEYSQLMSVTASKYGENLRSGLSSHKMYSKYLNNYSANGADPSNLVTWVESHDNYCNDDSATQINDDEIRIGWALIASKGDTTPLFFARPKNSSSNNKWGDNVLGSDGNGNYYHPEVAAVNHFRNAMIGEDCTVGGIDRNYAHIYVQRGSKGVVIINFTDNDFDVDTATKLPDGEYTDEAYGRAYTVANGRITGTVKANTVAVIYDRGEEPTTIESTTAEATEELTTDASTTVEPTEDTTAEPTTEAPTTEPIETTVEPTTVEPTTEPAPAATYTVAGSSGAMFGTTWDATNTANDMVKGNDGVYSITYTNVPPEDAIQLKVVKNHAWDEAWGDKETGDNYTFNVATACDITITFDPATETVNVTGDGVKQDDELDVYSVIAVGNGEETYLNNVNWNPSDTANSMTEVADGIWEMTMEDIYAFDNYNIKFAVNSIDDQGNPTSNPWAHNFGSEVEKVYPTGNPIDAVYNGKNCIFEVEEDGSTVKLQLDLREFNFKTKKGAKMTITVTAPEPEPTTEEQETFDVYSVIAFGNGEDTYLNGVNWDPADTSNALTEVADGVWEITMEDIYAFDNYNIKFAVNSIDDNGNPTSNPWAHNFGSEVEQLYPTGAPIDAVYNGRNCIFEVEKDGSTVKLQLDLSNFDFKTKSGAKMTITVMPPTEGILGDCTWKLDGDGTLTISGNGSTGDYDYKHNEPWNSFVKKVIINEGVTKIGSYTFNNCPLLTSISIPASVNSIDERLSFIQCENLDSISISDGNTVFDSRNNCNAIIRKHNNHLVFGCKSTIIPEGVLGIGEYAFAGCSGLNSIVIPEGVTYLGADAFSTCINLESVVLPESLLTIGAGAFFSCEKLTSIRIPNSVTTISRDTFRDCKELEQVIIGNNVKYIGAQSFEGCKKLKNVNIPSSVTQISVAVFQNCDALSRVTVDDNVNYIGESAFNGCPNVIIFGHKNSYVQKYAQENALVFVEADWCKNCGAILSDEVIVVDEGKPSTCVESGLTNGTHCSVCGEVIETQEIIPANGHTEIVDEGYPATCKDFGLTNGSHCSVCGEIIKTQEVIPLKEHIEVIDKGYQATCTDNGLTDGSHCSECGEILTEQTVIPAKGHTIVFEQKQAPTCTENGHTAGSRCSVCGEVFIECEIIPATGHTKVTDKGYPATCTEDGLTDGSHCSVCDETITKQQIIPAKGHVIMTVAGKEPTCTETGLTEYKYCSVCNEVFEEAREIPAKGHTEVIDKGYPATCTEKGLTDGAHCSVCNEVLTEQEEIPAIGHKPIIDPAVPATCQHDGHTLGSHCENCGLIYVQYDIIPKLPHTVVVDEAVAPSCTETGLTEGSHCSACGEVLIEQETVPALGHKYIGVPGTPATYSHTGLTDGIKCERCGEWLIEQEVIPRIESGIIGDANNDGVVDVLDATLVQKFAVDKTTFSESQKQVADVNCDGVVDILDATQIQKYAVDKISSF